MRCIRFQIYMAHEKNILEFSRSKFELYIVRYGLLIAFPISCIAVAWGGGYPLSIKHAELIILLSFFYLPIGLITSLLSRKFIYKVVVDNNKNEIALHLFKKNRIEKKKISEIQTISINFYVTFFFNNKKLVFKGEGVSELIKSLQTIRPITWGYFSKWLYPHEERNKI